LAYLDLINPLKETTINVCDDEPVLFKTYLDFVANTLGSRSPFHVPVWLAKVMLGASVVETLMASVRCRTEHFKEMTGWQPDYPSYRTGVVGEVNKQSTF
jgi:NAD dependent epimerase/dehydratase family enzyme